MKPLQPSELDFWNQYLATLPTNMRPSTPFVEASFAGGRESTDYLIGLYLEGKKTAGSGLVKDFLSAGDPLPKVGNYWIALDSNDKPRIILKTVRTEINVFGKIPRSVVLAEGEGDLSTEHWKRVHRNAYTPFLASWGIQDINEAEVITEHFEIVHR